MLYGQYENVEIWKKHPEYVHYEVSTFGRVRRNGRILKENETSEGKMRVEVYVNGKGKHKHVGVLVLETFVGPRPYGMICCHGSLGRKNHSVNNVRWGTYRQNNGEDVDRDGTRVVMLGEKNGRAKLSVQQVEEIRQKLLAGHGVCKLAREYGVTHQNISCIKHNKSWGPKLCRKYAAYFRVTGF